MFRYLCYSGHLLSFPLQLQHNVISEGNWRSGNPAPNRGPPPRQYNDNSSYRDRAIEMDEPRPERKKLVISKRTKPIENPDFRKEPVGGGRFYSQRFPVLKRVFNNILENAQSTLFQQCVHCALVTHVITQYRNPYYTAKLN